MDEEKLFQKLRDLEALFAGATTPGERVAAGNARERILARLAEQSREETPEEYRFSMADVWSMKLFLTLLRRYGLVPYRYRGQRRTTVMVRVPRRFVDETLWPHYERANEVLRGHLDEVASRVMEQALDAKDVDVETREEQRALPLQTK
jgi:hypothetical protein